MSYTQANLSNRVKLEVAAPFLKYGAFLSIDPPQTGMGNLTERYSTLCHEVSLCVAIWHQYLLQAESQAKEP